MKFQAERWKALHFGSESEEQQHKLDDAMLIVVKQKPDRQVEQYRPSGQQ